MFSRLVTISGEMIFETREALKSIICSLIKDKDETKFISMIKWDILFFNRNNNNKCVYLTQNKYQR